MMKLLSVDIYPLFMMKNHMFFFPSDV